MARICWSSSSRMRNKNQAEAERARVWRLCCEMKTKYIGSAVREEGDAVVLVVSRARVIVRLLW